MKTISIDGIAFEVSTPYAEGHVLTVAEAKVLNQTRCENIGNNFRKAVKDAKEKGGDMSAVASALREYDASYIFTVGGTSRTPIDPIEAEAIRIAKEVVKAKLAEKGLKVKDYVANEANAAKYDAAVDKIASQDDTLKLAKQRVANKKKVADVAADDLALDA
jgi:hypothetical protein